MVVTRFHRIWMVMGSSCMVFNSSSRCFGVFAQRRRLGQRHVNQDASPFVDRGAVSLAEDGGRLALLDDGGTSDVLAGSKRGTLVDRDAFERAARSDKGRATPPPLLL